MREQEGARESDVEQKGRDSVNTEGSVERKTWAGHMLPAVGKQLGWGGPAQCHCFNLLASLPHCSGPKMVHAGTTPWAVFTPWSWA